jgi:hypothetical protein
LRPDHHDRDPVQPAQPGDQGRAVGGHPVAVQLVEAVDEQRE